MERPSIFLYLFDKTVKAFLCYGGEIWGLRDWEELERIRLLAFKHILNVNTNTTTDAVYAELARNPLIASRHKSSIKFALRLASLKCDKLSKKPIISWRLTMPKAIITG